MNLSRHFRLLAASSILCLELGGFSAAALAFTVPPSTGLRFDPRPTGQPLGPRPSIIFSGTSFGFPDQGRGLASTAQTLTLTNYGSADLLFTRIFTGGDFAQTNNCGSSLGVGASCAIAVTFTPSVIGTRTGALTISASNAAQTFPVIALSGTGAGSVASVSATSLTFASRNAGSASAAQSVTLTNSGKLALKVSSIATSGTFSQSNTCAATLAAGAKCTISTTYVPTANGARTGSLSITSNADSGSLLKIGLSAAAAPPTPGITLSSAGSHGVATTIIPKPSEVGQALPVWLAAELGGQIFLRGAGINDWSLYQGGPMPIAQQVTAMPSSTSIDVLDYDVSAVPGLSIYAAYGDLSLAGHLAKLLTVQKRATIVFPDPASPIAFVTYSPLGQGVVARRGASGSIEKLGVVEADGTYYQLLFGSAGTSGMKMAGYEFAVLSRDAKGDVAGISISDPTGVVTSYGVGAVGQRSELHSALRAGGICPQKSDPNETAVCEMVMAGQHPTLGLVAEVLTSDPVSKAVARIGTTPGKIMDFGGRVLKSATGTIEAVADFFGFKKVVQVDRSADEVAGSYKKVAEDLVKPPADGDIHNVIVGNLKAQLNGADEIVDKSAVRDAAMLSRDPQGKTLEITDSATLKTMGGSWVNPVSCASGYAPIKNACVPAITSITPAAAVLGQTTTFVASGMDLTDGMEVTLAFCTSIPNPKSSGTNTRQQVTCRPSRAGNLSGVWTQAGTGSLVSNFSVLVCNSNQTVANGACVTPTTTTTTRSTTTTTRSTTTTTLDPANCIPPATTCSSFMDPRTRVGSTKCTTDTGPQYCSSTTTLSPTTGAGGKASFDPIEIACISNAKQNAQPYGDIQIDGDCMKATAFACVVSKFDGNTYEAGKRVISAYAGEVQAACARLKNFAKNFSLNPNKCGACP